MQNNSQHKTPPTLPMKNTVKLHPERWFKSRVGTEVYKINGIELIKITIQSEQHAKAMYISQREKQIKYAEI